ncbi:hypothetical protein AC578_5899 [Pseudocercospora eumusae]|uniref:Uncharacterized protein n=1 Tax=Pseudocercospora eumusae TaxID=321146 RepID=A0A139HBF3_9PEZI|nr:hypothetical protein AC578_5899 [Pseudocercospora eumusae]
MARRRFSGCMGARARSKARQKNGPDAHCDNPGDSMDMIFESANNDPKRSINLYRDLYKNALSIQPQLRPPPEQLHQLFKNIYYDPAVTERNLRAQVRLVQNDKFLWSKELEGCFLYLHFGDSGLTRTFLRELRELAEMRHKDSDDHALTWEQALELLKRAQSRRHAGQCNNGTSTALEWQPSDCKIARAIAEEELGFVERPIETARKRGERKTSEEATPSQPDGGEEGDGDYVTRQGGHEDADQDKGECEGNGDGEEEMDIEQARGSGAGTGDVDEEPSPDDDLDPAGDSFDQEFGSILINSDPRGPELGETPKRASPSSNFKILSSPSRDSTSTRAHQTPVPFTGDNDETDFELTVMIRSPSQSPAAKKRRLLNSKSTPSSQSTMSDATRLEAACAFLLHFASTSRVTVTMHSHARAVMVSSTAPRTAVPAASTPPLFLALIAPPPHLPTSDLDSRWLLAQASNHERTSFTLRTPHVLCDPPPPATTAITLDHARATLAAVLDRGDGEGNIECRQEWFLYEPVDYNSRNDDGFISSLAAATCLMTDTDLPKHISFFAWEGALGAANNVHGRVSEVRRAVQLPVLPLLPTLEIPAEYCGDLLEGCLEKYSNRLTGCEQYEAILEHYLSQLRLIRECATSSAAHVDSMPAQASTERLDQRIAKLEELLALCDSDDEEAARYQQNLAKLKEQKAASQNEDRRKRLENLTSWIAISIQEADIEKSAVERSKKKLQTSLRNGRGLLSSMIAKLEDR